MRLFPSLLILVILQTSLLTAQDLPPEFITIGDKISLKSTVLNEEREVLIYKPENYDSTHRYQVIYLLDAEYFFTSTVGIVDALVSTRQIPDTILVGVKTTVRVRDFLPPIIAEPQSSQQKWTKEKFPLSGGTDNFTAFLRSELFPYIEAHYSTLPVRTLIGHSNAGVFGLYTLVNQPDTFTNYLLVSPAAWWGESEIDLNISSFNSKYSDFAGNLFLSVAGEGHGFYSNALRVAANLENKAPSALNWTLEQYKNETHQTTVYPSIYNGLVKIFDDFKFDRVDEVAKYGSVVDVQNYYRILSKRYKYEVLVPDSVLSELAQKQFSYNRNDMAIETLQFFIMTYPKSSFAYSSLGGGYMRTQQFSLAKSSFEKALALAIKQGNTDPSVTGFLNDMIKTVNNIE